MRDIIGRSNISSIYYKIFTSNMKIILLSMLFETISKLHLSLVLDFRTDVIQSFVFGDQIRTTFFSFHCHFYGKKNLMSIQSHIVRALVTIIPFIQKDKLCIGLSNPFLLQREQAMRASIGFLLNITFLRPLFRVYRV